MSTMWDNQNAASGQFVAAGNQGQRSDPKGTAGRLWGRNSLSLIALAVCAIYLVIDNYTHFVIFGLIPISLSIQAIRRREPLSILAIAATVVAVAVPFVLLQQ